MHVTEKMPIAQSECAGRASKKKRLVYIPILLVLLAANFLLSPFNIADGSNPFLDGDYGMLTHNALRILQGDVLYRDIWTVYTPATDHFIALIYLVLGDNLRSLRLALALAAAMTTLLVFLISRSLTSAPWALAIAALGLLMGPVCLNFPYPTWFCIPAGFAMLLIEHNAWKKNHNLGYFMAGIVSGVMFAFKPNLGIFAFATLAVIQTFEGILNTDDSGCKADKLTRAMSVILLISVPVMALALIKAHLTVKHIVFFVLPACMIPAAGFAAARKYSSDGHAWRLHLSHIVCSALGFCVVTFPLGLYLLAKLGFSGFYRDLIYPTAIFAQMAYCPLPGLSLEAFLLVALFCFQAVLIPGSRPLFLKKTFLSLFGIFGILLVYRMIPFMREGLFLQSSGVSSYSLVGFNLAVYLPLAVHLGVGYLLVNDLLHLDAHNRAKVHLTLLLWIFSVTTFLTFYPVMELYHLIWIMAPVTILGGVLLFRAAEFWNISGNSFLPGWRTVMKSLSLILIPLFVGVFFGMPMFRYFFEVDASPFAIRPRRFADINSNRAGILMPAERANAISEIVQCIEANTRPDDFIFDMTGSFFYFLANRRNPTKWGHFAFPRFFSQHDIQEIKFDLEATTPKAVVISYEAEKRFTSAYPELYRYIRRRYRPAKCSGEYCVLLLVQ